MNKGYAAAKSKVMAKIKGKILKRDGNKCIVCGSTNRLHLAHIEGLSYRLKQANKLLKQRNANPQERKQVFMEVWQDANSESNLVILCKRCHSIYDNNYKGNISLIYPFLKTNDYDKKITLKQLIKENAIIWAIKQQYISNFIKSYVKKQRRDHLITFAETSIKRGDW